MPRSTLQSSSVRLGLRSVPVDDPSGGAPPSVAGSLGFSVQHQRQTQWCWAAVTSSVAAFFGTTTWPQCRVVNSELDQQACCTSGSSPECNKSWYLDRSLTRTGNLALLTATPLTRQELSV